MRFSIITVSFNSEKTIERTIQSVLAQTFTDFEYIIVDGGSKDGTIDIVKKYEPQFEGRIKWKSEPDKGIYNAMNKGIARSTGDIIGIVNSDDWLETNALEIVNNEFSLRGKEEYALYCGGIIFHTESGEKRYLKADIELFEKECRHYYLAGIRHPATFVPKVVYNKVGLFDENIRIAADADFILRCKKANVSFLVINQFLSNMSDGGLSNRKDIYKIAKNDRRITLKKNGVTGVAYCYQMLYWILRKKTKQLFLKTGTYKVK